MNTWKVVIENTNDVRSYHIIGKGEICDTARIAEVNPYLKNKEEVAYLIAAASDLLEACKKMYQELQKVCFQAPIQELNGEITYSKTIGMKIAEEAIAKAEIKDENPKAL